jgi:hypothetical protein
MEILEFAYFALPYIILVYLAVLLFMRPPRAVLLASLLAGLLMGLINALVDLAAYYAHWWHYTLNDLILHVPLPFYITPVLVYGSIAYLLIWRFWTGRGHWFALLLLIGIPIFGIARDVLGATTNTSYTTWDSPLAGPIDALMWIVMFYAGFWLFRRLAPPRQVESITIRKQEEGTRGIFRSRHN